MSLVCDFCGDSVTSATMHTLSASAIIEATGSGFVPNRLPSHWSTFRDTLGISIDDYWRETVKDNSVEDWGLCHTCQAYLDGFNANSVSQTGKDEERFHVCTLLDEKILLVKVQPDLALHLDITLTGMGLNTHVVERSKTFDIYTCQKSIPIANGPKPCAQFCIHNSVVASAAFQAMIETGKAAYDESEESIGKKLINNANFCNYLFASDIVDPVITERQFVPASIARTEAARHLSLVTFQFEDSNRLDYGFNARDFTSGSAADALDDLFPKKKYNESSEIQLLKLVSKLRPGEMSFCFPKNFYSSGLRGSTLLHFAVETGCADAVKAIISKGVDPDIRNAKGKTALELAMNSMNRADEQDDEYMALCYAELVEYLSTLPKTQNAKSSDNIPMTDNTGNVTKDTGLKFPWWKFW